MGKKAAYELSNYGKSFRENATTENYLAFAAWIITGKMPNLGVLMDEEESNKRMKELDSIYARGEKTELANAWKKRERIKITKESKKGRTVYLTNIETGEKLEFSTIQETSKYLAPIWNMKATSIEVTLRMRKEYKGYKIHITGETQRRYNAKPIVATNIKTGEKHKFDCFVDCTRFMTNLYSSVLSCGAIKEKVQTGKLYKETWKFEYV